MKTKIHVLIHAATLTALVGLGGLQGAIAATVDLASVPMVSGVSKVVPPNVYFILDDSGSMDSEYMPDSVSSNSSKNCYMNFGYNRIFYDPNVTYQVPKKADGTDYGPSSYTAAKDDGFSSSSGTVDLSKTQFGLSNNPFSVSNNSNVVTVTHNNHGFTVGTVVSFSPSKTFRNITISGSYTITSVSTNSYTITASTKANANDSTNGGNNVVETSPVASGIYYNYTSNPTSPPATCASDASYTKKVPSTTTEKTNYANWYSYYRKRILMMKSASGRAFNAVDDKYRVGFSTISETGTGGSFLNVGKFGTTQKTSFYDKLYKAGASGYTPLRGALSKAGRLYSGTLTDSSGNKVDPVQYSCQQNFTILTTDGYWNKTDESTGGNASSNYGPYRANNTTLIGDWDAAVLATATTPASNPATVAETTTAAPYLDAGPYSNTLADIAAYFYRNDIRPTSPSWGALLDDGSGPLDVSADNVPTAGADSATWQHMTTFTIGLGVAGNLKYREDYLTCPASDSDCDYGKILQGTKNWPDPQTGSNSDTVTTRIDDLWHAAVNGHGQYLSASNPDTVVSALSKTLAAISQINASAAAAATSSLEPVAGDNYAYVAQYTTGLWYGDMQARDIDTSTGALSSTASWSAKDELVAKVGVALGEGSRNIFTFSSASGNKLKAFTPANLVAEKTAGYFKSSGTNPNGALSQYASWSHDAEDGRDRRCDDQLPSWEQRQRGRGGQYRRLFRDRSYALGDIVDTSPVYVQSPPFEYVENSYAAFKAPLTKTFNSDGSVRQPGPPGDGVRRRQRRHATCLRCSDGRGAVGVHPGHADPEPVQAGRHDLRDQSPFLRGRPGDGG